MNFSGAMPFRLVASALAALAFLFQASFAFALSEDQLVAKLNLVPVFTIADAKNTPLLLVPKNDKNTAVLNFYLDPALAKQAMQVVKTQNPDKNKTYRVAITSLGQAYKVAKDEQKKQSAKVRFQFLSSPKSVEYATEFFRKKDPNFKTFQGVPVFFLSGGSGNGILTLKREGQEYLPMFFSEVDLQRNLLELRKVRSDLPKNLSVEATTLDSIVGTILNGKNDNDSQKITFIPAKDALDYVKTVQKDSKPK
ncbi:Tic22 family protein [Gloeobacter morelensis]|uniref:Tic22-like protein n=1 Tax=Gloeobacter morelensis MG652769 TaxID=2781736 RepID=A0ABY3PR33_9CYAN|nr:Tic22 family protein [Gloeobacter morelensis]UFP96185.1 hypothetical protein ISF26_08260 [Gloeobacter morelensis MG652769]